MNILLIMHECNGVYNTFPYGIGYLSAILRNAGHSVTIYDQATTHCTDQELYTFVKNSKPFGFIGMGFQSAYYHFAKSACAAAKSAQPKTPLVLGGSAPSATPEHFFNDFKADYVLVGECEETILKLVEVIQGNSAPEKVEGLYWKDASQIHHSKRGRPPQKLDSLPFPAWDLFDMKSYTFSRRVPGLNGYANGLGILTSRGCPYACKFCYRMEKGFRMRSIENCLEEIKLLVNVYKVNYLAFDDDLFMSSKKRTMAFCDAILKSGMKFNWYCSGRFNIADREQIRIMKKAGCLFISYGLESGDQRILDEMDKRTTVEQIVEISEMTKEEGILVSLPSMFGLPGEDEKTIQQTVDIILKTTSWFDRRTLRPMQPYPGSNYFNQAIEQGLLKNAEDFYNRFFSSESWTVNFTNLSDTQFNKVLFKANKQLLREHYKQALKVDLATFENIYFKKDARSFIPMR